MKVLLALVFLIPACVFAQPRTTIEKELLEFWHFDGSSKFDSLKLDSIITFDMINPISNIGRRLNSIHYEYESERLASYVYKASNYISPQIEYIYDNGKLINLHRWAFHYPEPLRIEIERINIEGPEYSTSGSSHFEFIMLNEHMLIDSFYIESESYGSTFRFGFSKNVKRFFNSDLTLQSVTSDEHEWDSFWYEDKFRLKEWNFSYENERLVETLITLDHSLYERITTTFNPIENVDTLKSYSYEDGNWNLYRTTIQHYLQDNFPAYIEIYDEKEGISKIQYYYSLNNDTSTQISETNNPISDLIIYPNPVSSIININPRFKTPSKIEIFNTDGQVMVSQSLRNEFLNISDLPAGVYILQIQSGEKKFTARFVKI